MAVQIEHLSKTYRQGSAEVHALRGVSCEMPAGAFTFVLGPSGSGKSTLLYLIGALEEPTEGRITVNDQSLVGLTPKQRDQYRREQIGFVFQSFNLLSNLTALENVLVPFLPRGVAPEQRQRAVQLLEMVGLGKRLDHRPGQLSGGEQQRVAITRALLKQPALILADEPTGELDSQNGAEVFGYLRQLSAEQATTVIVATHDHRYITDRDHVLTLRDGRLCNGDPV